MADDDTWEALAKRLTALIVKLDERDDRFEAMLEEQRDFNRQQVAINTRLETLMREVFQQRHNGHEA